MNPLDLPEPAAEHGFDRENVPGHIACVMDGNGRWAAQRGLARTDGHTAGERALKTVVEGSIEVGVGWLTVYAFSTENWTRPTDEVGFLMKFNESVIERRAAELHEQDVRLIFAGRHGVPVPESLAQKMQEAMHLTRSNSTLTLTVAFNYGGRAEIVDAMRAIATANIDPTSIDEAMVRSHLYVPDMPDVDLLIRTSNEFRISNFLLWQLAYSEMYFTDVLWPDFGRDQLFAAISDYQRRSRRFGGLSDEA